MATRIDLLVEAYEKVVKEPWSSALSGQERIWFLVYDPAEQRKIDLRLGDFETAAIKAGKKWKSISLKHVAMSGKYCAQWLNPFRTLIILH